MKKSNYILILLFSFLASADIYSQHGKAELKLSSNGAVESVSFYDSILKKENSFDVFENNPYKDIDFTKRPSERTGTSDVKYDLTNHSKQQLLVRFFPNNKSARENINNINFKSADVNTYVEAHDSNAVVIYNLWFFSDENLIAAKSSPIVINSQGKVISRLPESEEGYFEPALTKNENYIAFIVGDISPEASFTLFNGPQFKIYNVRTGREIFKIESGDYSFKSPVAFDNLIRIVLRRSNNSLEYNIISVEDRTVYKKEYTKEQIENLLRFQSNGMVFKDRNGEERLDEFKRDFVKVNF